MTERAPKPIAPRGAKLQYPHTQTVDFVDNYHGVRVADPYRWLEDVNDPACHAWIDEQNTFTRAWLDGPVRARLRTELGERYNYPRTAVPVRRTERYFYTHNTGLQNQSVLYVREGLSGAARLLLDPNTLSEDGTVALTDFTVNEDGTLVAYALSSAGSDRQDVFVRDVVSGRDLPDRLGWVKFSSIAWLHDGRGFYYTRFPEPGTVLPGDEHYYCQVRLHRLGTPQSEDQLIYDRPDDREIVFAVEITGDGRHLVVTAFRGASSQNEVVLLDLHQPSVEPTMVFRGFSALYAFIASLDDRLFFHTDAGAPMGRLVAVDLMPESTSPDGGGRRIPGAPVEIVPEGRDTLSAAVLVQRTLVVSYLHQASERIRTFHLDGTPRRDVPLPSLGSLTGLTGRPQDTDAFLGFMSFTQPPTNYRWNVDAGLLSRLGDAAAPDSEAYETRQIWYPSRDGTSVSMFLVHKRGLTFDGERPVLLTGYGGFNISRTPTFDAGNFVWLQRGGVCALANIRGGGEYGEAWHQAGMRERKQNVFDDFIAGAEWLIANHVTRADKLAIEGGSNGGLLVAAAMVQRPDLFGAVICRVPVVDMLRYHLFTVGRFWVPEYGSASDPEQFRWLYAYSPYHNLEPRTAYPATLVMTADTDDRVAPGMAKKFAARLQAATNGTAPILLRVETKAGHGAGKPITKLIDEDADIFAFLGRALQLEEL